MMDPITPAATPPLASPVEPAPSRLPRKLSLASVRSVFTLSVCSAPAAADKPSTPSATCPHCLEAITVSHLAAVLDKNAPPPPPARSREQPPAENTQPARKANLKLQTSGLEATGAASLLLKTLQDTNGELQTHCRDLHQIRLMNPSPAPSRRGSVCSDRSASVGSPSTPTQKDVHPAAADGFGHPLITDIGDLVNLSNANIRLLKTLQDKVNRVDWAEKMLREEREAIERERAHLKQMNAEVEKERVRLMAGGLESETYKVNPSRTQSVFTMSRSLSGFATPNGNWDEPDVADFNEEWTEEKEQHLRALEQELKKANRRWSDDQEEILEPLEHLREEKRRQAKARKLERQTSLKVERVNSQDDKKKPYDNSGKASPRSSGFLSSIRRKSSVGSIVRRDSSPTGTSQKIFKKWFP